MNWRQGLLDAKISRLGGKFAIRDRFIAAMNDGWSISVAISKSGLAEGEFKSIFRDTKKVKESIDKYLEERKKNNHGFVR
jgi:hypothetical protein